MSLEESEPPSFIKKLQSLPTSVYVAVLLLYVVFFFGSHKYQLPGLAERDGYFHARYSQMLPEIGVSSKFPWLQQSVLKEHFADQAVLHHVFMIPFTRDRDDPIKGAQISSLVLIVAVFFAVFYVLRKHNIPLPVLLTTFLLSLSGGFLFRLDMIRSHVVSILLSIIGIHFLLQQRWRALAILGFIFAWSYTFPFVLAIHAVIFVIGAWLYDRKLDLKSPVAATVGVLVGYVVHPHSPQTLDFFKATLDVLQIGAKGQALDMAIAVEYQSQDIKTLFTSNLLYLPVMALLPAGVLFLHRRKALSRELSALAVLAVAWLIATLRYARFVEYAVPTALLAAGFVLRDLQKAIDLSTWISKSPQRLTLSISALVLVTTSGHIGASMLMLDWAKPEPPHFKGAAQWLAANAYPRETIVNLYWHDFPELFYHAPRQTFIWGLDPVFTYKFNPEVGERLRRIIRGDENIDRQWMMNTLKARYLVLKNFSVEFNLPDFRKGDWIPVYADKTAIIFDLRRPPGPVKPAPTKQTPPASLPPGGETKVQPIPALPAPAN